MKPIKYQGFNPFDNHSDRLLAEIALNIQLPPSLHKKACDRFNAIFNYLENRESNIKGRIQLMYPQGSMAIDATISTRGTDDDFDLDLVAEFPEEFKSWSQCKLLNELYSALKDYQGLKVKRQTRCVTLYYADKMHIDITPSIRNEFTPEKESIIAHSKGPFSTTDDYWVDMNAYGFAGWYNERTPDEERVSKAIQERWKSRESLVVLAEAEQEDIPDQSNFVVKNTTTLALQLLKRFRDTRYANETGRIPPSVMLACYAGQCAKQDISLTDMLLRLANHIRGELERAELYSTLVKVQNPVFSSDVFTDRWPENSKQQSDFLHHIKDLIRGLEMLKNKRFSITELNSWLEENFGKGVVSRANATIAKSIGDNIVNAKQSYSPRGGIIMPATASLLTSASVVKASPHTFYGDPQK